MAPLPEVVDEALRRAPVAVRVEDDGGVELQVPQRRVRPRDRRDLLAHVGAHVVVQAGAMLRRRDRQVSGLVEQVARVEQAGLVHQQTPPVDADARQESVLRQLAGVDLQPDLPQEAGDARGQGVGEGTHAGRAGEEGGCAGATRPPTAGGMPRPSAPGAGPRGR